MAKRPPEEDRSHHLLVVKEIPPELIQLRNLLALPIHIDIYQAAIKGRDIGECLGIIAAKLDIAMDGEYDVAEVCAMLCEAMFNRGRFQHQPHLSAKGLVNVELVEREGDITIEHKGDEDVGT